MQRLQISVVIPTCNRRKRLLALLQNLDDLSFYLEEVIVVDSGNERLSAEEYTNFTNLRIQYLQSEPSVCIQRNTGIQKASSPWIFLCDDDIELPADYLNILAVHAEEYKVGAVSGVWLQQENGKWVSNYPLRSGLTLFWKFIFQQGVWGEIEYAGKNPILKRIKRHYLRKGNHISKAGWPVNIDFSGDFYTCPVYSLGASLVKKEWLLNSPFDEVLDQHGIGDNYGVILGFPFPHMQVTNKTSVYHHREPTNRLKSSLQYYRRVMALDYFIRIKRTPGHVKRRWLLWSLIGNLAGFLLSRQVTMIKATLKAIWKISSRQNPYHKTVRRRERENNQARFINRTCR